MGLPKGDGCFAREQSFPRPLQAHRSSECRWGGEPGAYHCNKMRKVTGEFLQLFPFPCSSLLTTLLPHPGTHVCVQGLSLPGLGAGEEDVCVSIPNQPVLHWGADLFLLHALFGSNLPLTVQSQFSGACRSSCPPPPSPPSAPTPESPLPRGTGGSRIQVGTERCWWLSLWGLLVWLG